MKLMWFYYAAFVTSMLAGIAQLAATENRVNAAIWFVGGFMWYASAEIRRRRIHG